MFQNINLQMNENFIVSHVSFSTLLSTVKKLLTTTSSVISIIILCVLSLGHNYTVPASHTLGKNRRFLAKICTMITLDTVSVQADTIFRAVKSCRYRKVTLRFP